MLLLDSQGRSREIEQLLEVTRNHAETARSHSESLKADGEHIRRLVRIAEVQERRLTAPEGDDTSGKPK